MKALSLQPFIPSGPDFAASAALFRDLGFTERWNSGDYAGFENNGFGFILQKFDNKRFAEHLMLTVGVANADQVWQEIREKDLEKKYGIRLAEPADMPYGREVNMIDIAGVCWHFVQE